MPVSPSIFCNHLGESCGYLSKHQWMHNVERKRCSGERKVNHFLTVLTSQESLIWCVQQKAQMSRKEPVALGSYRHFSGGKAKYLCYLAQRGAGGSVLFLCMCSAYISASIGVNFQVDPALFTGNHVEKLPFCRGYNWGAGTERSFVLRVYRPSITK